jgi:STE24 endopeptidase
MFFGILLFLSDLLSIPFSAYFVFSIEVRFGFNKMTVGTFFTDKIKGWLLAVILGGGLLSLIIWLYMLTGPTFWLITWGVITLFSIFMSMFYSQLIVPLFNKQKPLEEGHLRDAIETYCQKTGFKLKNVYVIDGSKRSKKANAYFTGLGSKKRIVLYDTLIKDHTIEELVAVLAHETGHYKKRHTLWGMLISIITTGIMLYVFSLFIDNPELSKALGASRTSFHMGLLACAILYSPLSLILGLVMNLISRRHEFAADRYAAQTYSAKELRSALIKLSVNNLSNLRPHPATVFFHYSHPPLLKRLQALENIPEPVITTDSK